MKESSSLELNEEREYIDDSKIYKGNDSYGFTKEQHDQPMNLLHSSGSNANFNASSSKVNLASHVTNHSNIGSWIVDFGASYHIICSSLTSFDTYEKIAPIDIKLSNGHMAIARSLGTVQFSLGLVTQNVLFVPEFAIGTKTMC